MTPDKILETLESGRFERWYSGKFADYISGELAAPSREEILAEIAKMFHLNPTE